MNRRAIPRKLTTVEYQNVNRGTSTEDSGGAEHLVVGDFVGRDNLEVSASCS
jgi:hypothetical protein